MIKAPDEMDPSHRFAYAMGYKDGERNIVPRSQRDFARCIRRLKKKLRRVAAEEQDPEMRALMTAMCDAALGRER